MGIIFKPNRTVAEGGGLTSKIIPYQLTKVGIGAGMAIGGAATIGKEMFANHNRIKMGPVSYQGGPARMTHNVTSGAIEAIKSSTNDPEVQADMLQKVLHYTGDSGELTGSVLGNLEEFGIDSQFMSAFYGM